MQDLTTGSIPRHLLNTTSYMLVTMLFQTLYFLADLYWVGRLGREAVAAVSIAGNLMFAVLAVTQMLAVGTTTLVAHAAGDRDQARAVLVFKQSQVLSLLSGGLFFALTAMMRGAYARTLSADGGTAALAEEYLVWFLPAMGLQFGMVAMGAALRGTGNFRPGMVVQSATVAINAVLAPILMFGWLGSPVMGVTGAALATFISILVGIAWMALYFLPTDAYLRFAGRGGWTPDLTIWRKLLGIGLPAGAEFGLIAVYMFAVYVVTRRFGAAAQAGFGIGQRVIQALFMPIVALGFAVAPVAGQNFGARRGDRVRDTFKTAALLAIGTMTVLIVVCQIAPATLIRIFSRDPDVIAVGADYLRIVSYTFIASGLVFVTASMFQAMGNTIPSLITSFVRIVIVVVPMFLLARLPGFELRWVWYLTVLSITLQMAMALLLLRREFGRRLNFGPLARAGARTVADGQDHHGV
jgi:putative MATE family efflux protein